MYNRRLVKSSKQNIIFRILSNLKNLKKLVLNLKKFAIFKIYLTEILINYKNFTNFWAYLNNFLNKYKNIEQILQKYYENNQLNFIKNMRNFLKVLNLEKKTCLKLEINYVQYYCTLLKIIIL